MPSLEDRLHNYADHLERSVPPLSVRDILARDRRPSSMRQSRPSRSTWRVRRLFIVAFVAAVVIVAVVVPIALRGGRPVPSNPTPASGRTISQQLEQALAAWERFPVDDSPRPLVLVGQRVLDPLGGFPSGAAKLAYIEGAIDGPAKFPSGPGSADDYRVIGAKDAFAAFKSAAAKGPPTSTRLTVTTVRFGSGVFLTDRGPLRLPAWLFSFQSVREPAIVLTVDPTSIFTPPPVRQIDLPAFMTGAHLGSDGRTLTVEFAGAPAGTGPCTADYTLDVATSRTAVAVAVEEHAHGGNTPCLLPAVFRQVTTVLSVPLGARVVVAVSGAAVAATRSG